MTEIRFLPSFEKSPYRRGKEYDTFKGLLTHEKEFPEYDAILRT